MAKPVALILDDHAPFRDALARELRQHGVEGRPCDPTDSNAVRMTIPADGDIHLLYDINMEPEDWLERLEQEPELADRLRIWIVTGMPDMDITGIQATHPRLRIQERWFDKHRLDVAELATELKPPPSPSLFSRLWGSHDALEPYRELLQWYEDYPGPVRLIDKHGQVAWANRQWAANPQVPPVDDRRIEWLIKQFQDKQHGRWHETLMWGVIPHGRNQGHHRPTLKKGYFRLLEGIFDLHGQPYVLQALGHAPNLAELGLSEAVGRVLEAMGAAGFDSALFYRVESIPGTDHMTTRLEQVYDDTFIKAKVGQLCLANHVFKSTIQRLHKQIDKPRDLVAARRDPTQCQGCAMCTEVAQSPLVRDIVEIPVFDNTKEKKLIGLMLCLRFKKEDEPHSLTSEIKEILHWHSSYLLGATVSLRNLIAEEQRRKEIETQQAVLEALRRLNGANGLDQLEGAILDAAIRLTGADGGLLITKLPSDDGIMVLRARQGDAQKLLPHRIPKVGDLATVEAFENKRAVGEPQFQGSERQRKLMEQANLVRLDLTTEATERLRNWIEAGIGSLLAVPLKQGDEVIGALSLQHAKPLHFDRQRVAGLNTLIDTAAKLLEAETDHNDRRLKQRELLHRLGGRVKPLMDLLDDLQRCGDTPAPTLVEEGVRHVHLLSDMIRRLRDTDRVWQLEQSFPIECRLCLETVTASVRKSHPDLDVVDPILETEPGTQRALLRGEQEALLLAYTNLFTNACQHREGNGAVYVCGEQDGGKWRLFITNPGCIPPQDQQNIFRMDRRGSQAKGSGLGMGLAIARDVAELHGGDVRLVNDGMESREVTFVLEWPLANRTNEEGPYEE